MTDNNKFPVLYKTEEEIAAYKAKKKKEDEAIKKEAAKTPEKKFYDIRLEALVPCTLTYRIFAEDENIAISNIDRQSPRDIKPNIRRKKNIKATVYDSGSNTLILTKAFKI